MRGLLIALALFVAMPVGAQPAKQPAPMLEEAQLLKRWPAPEARQGVAVDAAHFYAVTNSRIGKYRKADGVKVGEWVGDKVGITHINSCVIEGKELVCANSNFPNVPMLSSVEIFDPAEMRHIRSVPLGNRDGSLTWVERHSGQWWACFANYDGPNGEPGRDHTFTQIVIMDDQWRRIGGYGLPKTVIERFAPLSNSGGSWGDDGLLYLTGHDASEFYVVKPSAEGPTMSHVASIPAPIAGQAWAWDRSNPQVVYGILRKTGEVVVIRMPKIVDSASH